MEREEEAKARLRARMQPTPIRTEPLPPGGGGRAVGYTSPMFLDDRTNIVKTRRTSLIIDPPDGRLPELISAGEASRQDGSFWEDRLIGPPVRVRSAGRGANGPEDRGLAERCLVGSNSGPPMRTLMKSGSEAM